MDLKQFLQLFNPKPGNRFLQITDIFDETTVALQNLLEPVSGELHLVCYNIQEAIPESDINKIQYIQDMRTPFRALPREHDVVIFKNVFHLHQNQDILLKIAYATLANNAKKMHMWGNGL